MGTMTLVTTNQTVSRVTVPSNLCADVLSAAQPLAAANQASGYFALACTGSGEVTAGDLIFLKLPTSAINTRVWTVQSIDAPSSLSIDYTGVGVAFAFGLSTVVGFWLLARSVGLIVNLVRR